MDPLDAAFLDEDEVRAALAARDLSMGYRLLGRVEVSQHRIAQLTGQSQSGGVRDPQGPPGARRVGAEAHR